MANRLNSMVHFGLAWLGSTAFRNVKWRHQYVFVRMDMMMLIATKNNVVMMVYGPFTIRTQNLYSICVALHAS